MSTGTFARVWLSSLAGGSKENKDKVFALKILRKTDSKRFATLVFYTSVSY